ncbi:hypothetical protein [Polaromonas sp.]|uniref:hypothetical protein n=1 Tax=Polaromonas sp. TaxID=1869339 RepID=UPI0018570757|nr:hypothetical protein [Polaromonas sp.]NMM08318.1 hypothetical protein [Polaromonas sp.]
MLDAAGLRSTDVDTFVAVSSTGIAPPSVEARAARQVGFLSDLERVRVFRLGCAGAVTGLSITSRLAEARPGSVVAVVAIELYTLSSRLDEPTKANIVATWSTSTILTARRQLSWPVEAGNEWNWLRC